jgi:multidrug efflux pump subunit AcrA (membrane-fusion protein)
MNDDLASSELHRAEETWHEIDELVDDVAKLSRSDCSLQEFHAELLTRSVGALAAVAGAVWRCDAHGRLSLQSQINFTEVGLVENPVDQRRHGQLIESVLRSGIGRVVPPRSGPAQDELAGNATHLVLIVAPIVSNSGPTGVIELFQRPGTSPGAQAACLRFLEEMCRLAADFDSFGELRALRARTSLWGRYEQFAQRVHAGLDLQRTAFSIVNESLRLIEADRISVLAARGSGCRLLAVSGVDTFDRRANPVRRVEELADVVLAGGEPLWFPARQQTIAPEIERPLHGYLETSPVTTLAVVPLREPELDTDADSGRAIGVLVVERFEGDLQDDFDQRVLAASLHAASALGNALEYNSTPLLAALRPLRGAKEWTQRQRWPKLTLGLILLTAIVLVLCLVPADFDIQVRGALEPELRRDVFAPDNGVISELAIGAKERVSQGDVLAVLRNQELDLEFRRVLGEMQIAAQRLATAQSTRLDSDRSGRRGEERYRKLTSDEEEFKVLLQSLQRQHAILKEQRAALTIRSPLDGNVLTWDAVRLLDSRPVQRGQVLMTVADLNGPWVLELQIPDDRVGHVLSAQESIRADLEVSFMLASDPGVVHRERIERVALAADVDEDENPTVLTTVQLERTAIPRPKPGLRVNAQIHCGRRAIGYVWLHGLWEAVQRQILF